MPKRLLTGVVQSDKMTKTRVVVVPRTVRHPVFGKLLKRRTVCYVHDEQNQSAIGDTVEIEESRPLSKTKRWNLVRVVKKSDEVDIAGLRASRRKAARDEQAANAENDNSGRE
jgi:small subunit ribosomal protein S17